MTFPPLAHSGEREMCMIPVALVCYPLSHPCHGPRMRATQLKSGIGIEMPPTSVRMSPGWPAFAGHDIEGWIILNMLRSFFSASLHFSLHQGKNVVEQQRRRDAREPGAPARSLLLCASASPRFSFRHTELSNLRKNGDLASVRQIFLRAAANGDARSFEPPIPFFHFPAFSLHQGKNVVGPQRRKVAKAPGAPAAQSSSLRLCVSAVSIPPRRAFRIP